MYSNSQKFSEQIMLRCFHLARKAFRTTNKNPMVGSILVHNNKIIGEGYHQVFGKEHAEVNCFKNVSIKNQKFIHDSILYVSLEPCSFIGKTPACSQMIIQKRPKKVIISCLDPNPKVAGSGIEMIKNAGIEVEIGILEEQGKSLLRKFEINLFQKRPYVALKWAQSTHGYAGLPDTSVWFTNDFSRIKAHQIRANFEAILIGSNTVSLDNPTLDVRYSIGQNPIKIVVDRFEKIPKESQLFHNGENCIIITLKTDYQLPKPEKNKLLVLPDQKNDWKFIFEQLFLLGISSVLVEGGPTIQKSIIKDRLWDEAHVLSSSHQLDYGIKAPNVEGYRYKSISLGTDKYNIIIPQF